MCHADGPFLYSQPLQITGISSSGLTTEVRCRTARVAPVAVLTCTNPVLDPYGFVHILVRTKSKERESRASQRESEKTRFDIEIKRVRVRVKCGGGEANVFTAHSCKTRPLGMRAWQVVRIYYGHVKCSSVVLKGWRGEKEIYLFPQNEKQRENVGTNIWQFVRDCSASKPNLEDPACSRHDSGKHVAWS